MGIAFAVSTIFKSKDEQSKNFNRMGKNAKKFGEKTSKAFKKASKSATSFQTIAKGILTAGAVTKGLSLVRQGIGTVTIEFLEFDSAITQASAKFKGLNLSTKEGQKTLLELKKAARETGSQTKFSAGEAAAGLDFYATAGFNAAQAMAVLKPTAKLATIANLDLGRTADIASDSLGAFGLMTKDSTQLQKNFTRISDVMAKTMTSTNTNMEDMFEAIKKGAPTFTATGQRIETFNALMGTMANAGIKGSESGTQLRNIMLSLSKPTGEAQEAIETLGIRIRDQKGNFRDIIDILGDFEKGLSGMGSAQRAAALKTIFGVRSVTGLNLLLQEGTPNLRKFRDELDNSAGATDAMSKVIDQSLMNRLLGLKSAAIEVGFQLFTAFEDKGGSAIDFLTEKVRKINLTPVIEIIKKVSKFAGDLLEKFKAFGERTGLFDAINKSINDALPLFEKIFNFVSDVVKKFVEIGERTGLFDKISTAIKTVVPVFKTLFDIVETIFDLLEKTGIFDLIITRLGLIVDVITSIAKGFTELWNIAKPVLLDFVNFIKPIITALKPLNDAITKGLILAFEKLWDIAKPILEKITNFISPITNAISGIFKSFGGASGISESIIKGIKGATSTIEGLIGDNKGVTVTSTKTENAINENLKSKQRNVQELIKEKTRQLESTFKGQLDIAGAPEGSTFTRSPGSDNSIDVTILGAG